MMGDHPPVHQELQDEASLDTPRSRTKTGRSASRPILHGASPFPQRAQVSEGGLDYSFATVRTTEGYEFQLRMTNTSTAPIELHYATGEIFNFITSLGTEPVWDYNANLFFMQSSITRTMAPGETITVAAPWNGCDYAGVPLAPQTYRFEAVHLVAAGPVRLSFDSTLHP